VDFQHIFIGKPIIQREDLRYIILPYETPILFHPAERQKHRYLLKVICLAVVYHLAARVGLKMAYVQINTSPVWPPTGIALAAPDDRRDPAQATHP
jgi:hypothetical protein